MSTPNTPTVNLVVASRDVDTHHRSKDIFDRDDFAIHSAADILDLGKMPLIAERIGDLDPHIVLLGPDLAVDHALSLIEHLELVRPEASVILVSEPDADLFRDALKAGVSDVLAPDADDAAWAFSIDRALATTHRLLDLTERITPAPTSQIITVLSPKGGSGKTTVSSNLAVSLAKQHPGEVVLIDLDLQFGDVAHALRVMPEFTLADTTAATADSTALKAFLTHRDPLYVLCAPDQPEEADDITSEIVGSIIDQLRESFSIIIIDTPAGLDDSTMEAIDRATDLVFVTSTDIPSVHAVRKELEILDRMGVTAPKRHLVMNRSNAKVGLDVKDISVTTGLEIVASVPSSREVPIAMNRGVPLMELDPKSVGAKSIASFAMLLTGETAKPRSRRLGLRR